MSGLTAHVALRRGDLDLDVTIEADTDEVVAVLGPNGAGKTTLLRALAGLERLAAGRVVLDGVVLDDVDSDTHVPPEQRPVGVVFQDYLLFAHLSVADNISFGLRSRGQSRAAAARHATDWLDRMELTPYGDLSPATLSGGQAQRVALARALATAPHLLLLDEPLSALDASARSTVRHLLVEHLRAHRGVRLLVTHDPVEGMALADRLLVLEAGRIVQSGTAAEVTRAPRSSYVADLVGVNLLRGRAASGVLEVDGGGRLVVAPALSGEVFAVIHPQAVALHRARPEGTARNVWAGEITQTHQLADRVRVTVAGQPPIVAEVTPGAVRELRLADRGAVWVSVKATQIAVHPV